jgi:zinc transport system ATP-binding protein
MENFNIQKKLLELRNVDAGYEGKTALKQINFDIYRNDFIGIIGPNGGGKTTLLKVILGLIPILNGNVNYYFPDDSGGKISKIGYLPQFSEVDKKFPISVLEVTLSGLMNRNKLFHGFSGHEKKIAITLLNEMGLGKEIHSQVGELSGGQLQRTFLARAIISSPELLILDEPSTYVDNRFEYELYDMLTEMNKKMAILLVSHDIGTISSYIKTIACVNVYLNYHDSNIISSEQLQIYNCPIDIITHGKVPHRVLPDHKHS